jgi:hypothetical protein
MYVIEMFGWALFHMKSINSWTKVKYHYNITIWTYIEFFSIKNESHYIATISQIKRRTMHNFVITFWNPGMLYLHLNHFYLVCAHLVRWNPTSSKDATSMHCESCHILILVTRTKPNWSIPSLFICHKFEPPIIHKGWGVRWTFYYFGLMFVPFKLMIEHHTCEFSIVFTMWMIIWLHMF